MEPAQAAILRPAAALVCLTAVVWTRLYVERVGEMLRRRIRPQSLATSVAALQEQRAAANFGNLCELPLLFYALCCALAAVPRAVKPHDVTSAWAYVGLRAAHSAVHCTYNRVTHRFAAYAASSVLLFGMWASFAQRLAAM